MTNPKGSRFEKELLDYFRLMQYDVERLRQTGTQDEGDLVLTNDIGKRYIIEAKNVAKMDLAGWVKEGEEEVANYMAHRQVFYANFAVVHKRRGKGAHHAYVTMPLYEWLEQIR
jgi:Holliday junction resolvase